MAAVTQHQIVIKREKPKTFKLIPKVINGGIAGIVGVSIVFPLDLVKTRLQNQTIGPNGQRQYKNIFDCFRQTYRQDGFFGMYRGVRVNMLFITPEKAIKLSSNDMFRHYLGNPDGTISLPRQMMAGGGAGFCQIVVTTPMDVLKIQMQDAGRVSAQRRMAGRPELERVSAWRLFWNLIRTRGILGLYRGYTATACRDITFSIIYFPLFATISDLGRKNPTDVAPPFWWSFISGLMAGSTAAFIDTPLDVVKTRMQTIIKGTGDRQCPNIVRCFRSTWKKEGMSAFFKGAQCRVMVIAPLFGILQTVYYLGIAERLLGLPLERAT